jgi:hypothetical protein
VQADRCDRDGADGGNLDGARPGREGLGTEGARGRGGRLHRDRLFGGRRVGQAPAAQQLWTLVHCSEELGPLQQRGQRHPHLPPSGARPCEQQQHGKRVDLTVGEPREQGVRHDLVAAVFALSEDDLVRLLARVDALGKFLGTEDGANLLIAYRRAANIVAIEEKRDSRSYDAEPKWELLSEPEENVLARSLPKIGGAVGDAINCGRFDEAMAALATLRRPVDEFFDKVTVNVDNKELRENRLRLLSRIRAVMNQVADFSQIEG